MEIGKEELDALRPGEFLSDTVMDFYIKYIQRPEVLHGQDRSRFYFFNTFFYKKLTRSGDSSKLRKWTKSINILEKDYVFIPIHERYEEFIANYYFLGYS